MPFETLRNSIGTLASGRARGSWRWKTAATLGPTVAAFVIQYFVLNATMARWALFYPAVFVASWLGGISSGLAATAIATALVPVFFMGRTPPDLTAPPNLISIFIFVTMGIAISVVHERLRTIMAQLEQSRQWLQAIMDNSPNVIVIKEMTGRYMMVNRQFEELFQLTPGAANDKTDGLLFPEATADLHRRTDAEVFAKRGAITYEETLQVHGENRVFLTSKFPLYNSEPYPFALCAIWSDITDRKRTEEALREREADLRQAERVAHLGSWMWNRADDTSRWSEELYRIMGIEPPKPADAPVPASEREKLTPEMPAIRNALRAILHDGRPHETEMEITRPDGTTRWIAVRGEAVRNERSEIVAVAGTAQDITELKELQRQRDEWTSVMAHDLRQPIGVITMAASALPEVHAASMPDKENELVARIASAAKGLARLVDDLLDLSLLEARRLRLDRHWVKPQMLVRDTVERLAHMVRENRVTVTEGQGLDDVCVDQMRMGQVLGNLISNAVKYGEKGSDIGVRIEQRGTEVDIAVENRGAGIPAEDIAHIFKRFARTAKARRSGAPGLGVGLYIAKELVEAHGGRIWAESAPGQTTAFHVALPTRAAVQKVA